MVRGVGTGRSGSRFPPVRRLCDDISETRDTLEPTKFATREVVFNSSYMATFENDLAPAFNAFAILS